MSEIDNISAAANRAFVRLQLHHTERAGVGQLAAFVRDIELLTETYQRQFDNVAARDGADVSAAKSALVTLANAVTAAANSRGYVEVPSAA